MQCGIVGARFQRRVFLHKVLARRSNLGPVLDSINSRVSSTVAVALRLPRDKSCPPLENSARSPIQRHFASLAHESLKQSPELKRRVGIQAPCLRERVGHKSARFSAAGPRMCHLSSARRKHPPVFAAADDRLADGRTASDPFDTLSIAPSWRWL